MNRFSYPLTIVQINLFEEPQNIFPNQNPRPQTIEPAPCIFNYRVPPLGVGKAKLMTVITSSLAFTPKMKTSSDSLCPTIIILPYSTLPYMYKQCTLKIILCTLFCKKLRSGHSTKSFSHVAFCDFKFSKFLDSSLTFLFLIEQQAIENMVL